VGGNLGRAVRDGGACNRRRRAAAGHQGRHRRRAVVDHGGGGGDNQVVASGSCQEQVAVVGAAEAEVVIDSGETGGADEGELVAGADQRRVNQDNAAGVQGGADLANLDVAQGAGLLEGQRAGVGDIDRGLEVGRRRGGAGGQNVRRGDRRAAADAAASSQ